MYASIKMYKCLRLVCHAYNKHREGCLDKPNIKYDGGVGP